MNEASGGSVTIRNGGFMMSMSARGGRVIVASLLTSLGGAFMLSNVASAHYVNGGGSATCFDAQGHTTVTYSVTYPNGEDWAAEAGAATLSSRLGFSPGTIGEGGSGTASESRNEADSWPAILDVTATWENGVVDTTQIVVAKPAHCNTPTTTEAPTTTAPTSTQAPTTEGPTTTVVEQPTTSVGGEGGTTSTTVVEPPTTSVGGEGGTTSTTVVEQPNTSVGGQIGTTPSAPTTTGLSGTPGTLPQTGAPASLLVLIGSALMLVGEAALLIGRHQFARRFLNGHE